MEIQTWIRSSGAYYYDLDEQAFVTRPRDAGADHPPRYFPVRHLLSTAGFFAACRRIADLDDGNQAKRRLAEADRLSRRLSRLSASTDQYPRRPTWKAPLRSSLG